MTVKAKKGGSPVLALHPGASGQDRLAATAMPVLSVNNLQTSFFTGSSFTPVVRGISFDVMAGETLAIVGESGSGKSVTAFSIMRLLAEEKARIEGSVKLDGRELLCLSEAEMRKVRGNTISMIFQEAMTSLDRAADRRSAEAA
jgi:peptide/nickel transport system ATP-binding protein